MLLVAALLLGGEVEARGRGGLLSRIAAALPWSEHARQARQIRRNARQGHRREGWARLRLRLRYPLSSIQAQPYLLDKRGRRLVDQVSGQARRFDYAVISPFGRVKALVEVTSPGASKHAQEAKTHRILSHHRRAYVQDRRTGALRRVRPRGLFPTHLRTLRLR